jgi:hypothetical protein
MLILSVNSGLPLELGAQGLNMIGSDFGLERGTVVLSPVDDPLSPQAITLAVRAWGPTLIIFDMPTVAPTGPSVLFVRDVLGITASIRVQVVIQGGSVPGPGESLIAQSENWTLPYTSIEPFIGRLLSHPPPQIPVGNAVFISVRTINHRTIPPQLSDPDAVTLQLTDSHGAQVVPEVAMTRLRTGIWRYLYQVGEDAPHGEWIARVKTLAGGFANQETFSAFVVTGN